ncbi:MAG: DUF45 domain-containing protein [Clostridiales bacterium]|nr:DUF45 domain-containing protein [Clostridiales bacterium]
MNNSALRNRTHPFGKSEYADMMKEIYLKNTKIQYDLQYKKVKNINLRIKPDGSIHVSANKRVPQKVIDEFLITKADFILKALEKYKSMSYEPKKQYFTEDEVKDIILALCKKVYPYFEKQGVKYPQIKFRKMVSRWGSCHCEKGILTFNTNLMYTPIECIEYVVLHEFTHFLQPNHSGKFYEELSKTCPRRKECQNKLKGINIR